MNQIVSYLLTATLSSTPTGEIGDVTEQFEKNVEKLPEFLDKFYEGAKAFALNLLIAVVVVIILKKFIKIFLKFLDRVFERSRLEEGICKFLISLSRTVCYIGVFFVFVGILNGGKFAGITAIITAIVGSAGLAIGLALQGSLQNFSGGVLILILKPFKIGDYIIVEGYEGVVETIDIFYTKLLTIDNRMVVLPNGALSNTNITNVTREEIRRVDLLVGIEYSENIDRVRSVLMKVIEKKPQIIKDREINIYVNNFDASSISMGIRVWCKTEDYWPLRWELLESIKNAFDENNIVIPFDQLDINLKQNLEQSMVNKK